MFGEVLQGVCGIQRYRESEETNSIALQMGRIYKQGRVAIVVSGRYAGKKVVVIKTVEEGSAGRPYPHALVAGVERYPRKVTRNMGSKRIAKRSKVKPFIKAVNYNHIMPTRHTLEMEGLKGAISAETFDQVCTYLQLCVYFLYLV